eukprot:3503145-Pleurochrysis_carterae.AAC.3
MATQLDEALMRRLTCIRCSVRCVWSGVCAWNIERLGESLQNLLPPGSTEQVAEREAQMGRAVPWQAALGGRWNGQARWSCEIEKIANTRSTFDGGGWGVIALSFRMGGVEVVFLGIV